MIDKKGQHYLLIALGGLRLMDSRKEQKEYKKAIKVMFTTRKASYENVKKIKA